MGYFCIWWLRMHNILYQNPVDQIKTHDTSCFAKLIYHYGLHIEI
jgi:hypothetical protein